MTSTPNLSSIAKDAFSYGCQQAFSWVKAKVEASNINSTSTSESGSLFALFEKKILNIGAYTRLFSYIPGLTKLCFSSAAVIARVALGIFETFLGAKDIFDCLKANSGLDIATEAFKQSSLYQGAQDVQLPESISKLTLVQQLSAGISAVDTFVKTWFGVKANVAQDEAAKAKEAGDAAKRAEAVKKLAAAIDIFGNGVGNLARAYSEMTVLGLTACAIYDFVVQARLCYKNETGKESLKDFAKHAFSTFFSEATAEEPAKKTA